MCWPSRTNPNESNGRMFRLEYPEGASPMSSGSRREPGSHGAAGRGLSAQGRLECANA